MRAGFLAVGAPGAPLRPGDVARLEGAGIDSLWAAGHVTTGRAVPEVVTGVARLAALTERVTVGTAVTVLPLYHPVVLAKQFAEVDRATGGRLAVGVGVGGEYPVEFDACGVPPAERGPRTDEAIEVLRALWTGGEVTREGRWWPLRGVGVAPPPARVGGPPLYVAGRRPPAMRRAARLGDGWLPFLYSPRAYAASRRTIELLAGQAGRDLRSFEWLCFVYTRVDDDAAAARRAALDFVGAAQAGDGGRFESMLGRMSAVGTPAEVGTALQRYLDAGARHLVLACCAHDDLLDQCRKVAEEVLPRLGPPDVGRYREVVDAGR